LIIALILNEIKNKFIKSSIQTVTYIPHLLSWAVVGGLWITIFSPSGLINGVLSMIQGDNFRPIVFMSESAFARSIIVFTGAWKGAGYFAALFLAAIVTIDQNLYEAAAIDGASRLKQIIRITIPSIVPTMKVITVLSAMGVLRNFDQIFIMANSNILDKIRNLLYLIYNDGIIKFEIGLATAAATLVLAATMIISFTVRKLIRYEDSYNE
jgi:putative aldouronate transport system permease protein